MERSIVTTIYRVRPTERLSSTNSNRTDLSVKSGSTVELHVWQGMLHVFPADVALLHAAREALDLAGDFLRRISPVERRATP
jgi:hypothetical protein